MNTRQHLWKWTRLVGGLLLGIILRTNTSTALGQTTNIYAVGPSNVTVCAGSPAMLSLAATGCDAFQYQWTRNGVKLVNQTNNSLVFGGATTNDAGLYAVEVTSPCGSVTNTATLVVTPWPALSCSTNKNVEWGAPWTFDEPTANYPLYILSTVTNTVGHCGNTFDVTRTWAAVDACGNSAQCSQTVNVVDTTAPVIGCSSNKTVQLGSAWSFDPPNIADNADTNCTLSVVSTVTNTVGHCGNTLDATRTWVVVDACGNSAQCSQTVSVVDTAAPMVVCSPTKVVQLGSAWSFDPPAVVDNDGTNWTLNVVSTVTNTVGHCGNTFDATRTWVAVDACGNSSQGSQTVNVVDTAAPMMVCCTNKVLQLGAVWSFDPPAVADNDRTNWTLSVVSTVTNRVGHCGSTFDATRTWLAVDACGNSSQCSQSVSVIDTTAPVIVCSTNKTVQLGTMWSFDPPEVTDNGGTNWTLSVVGTVTNTVGHCGNTFDATCTWAAVDACGNAAECSQSVSVVDTTAPVIACSTNKMVQLGSIWSFDPPSVTDNGGTNWTLSVVGTVTNTVGHCGNTFDATCTWMAVDACGNSAQCSQTVSVVDTTAPVIACSTNKTVQLGSAWSFDPPSVTDNGGTNWTLSVVSTVTNTVGHCGNTFDATRTWMAVDACGNSAPCSQTVSVVDTTAPVIACSTNKIVELGNAWSFDPPSVTDNGGTNVTLSVVGTVTNTVGHCGSSFDAIRVWMAVDACGNSAQCVQIVRVVDTTAPVIACSTNKVVELGSAWGFDQPSVTDNGGTNWTLSVVSTVTNTVGHCGNSFDATCTWAAVDGCGNAAQCSQTVSVVDTNPVVVAAAPADQSACPGSPAGFSIVATGTSLSYLWSHNSVPLGTNSSLVLTNVSAGDVGVYQVVVSDLCGNTVTNQASLTLNQPLLVFSAPVSLTNCPGDTATFSVQAAGTDVRYQWFRSPTPAQDSLSNSVVVSPETLALAGQTNSSLVLSNVGPADVATYSVVVSGACGEPLTNNASLTLNLPVQVLVPLADQVTCAGTTSILSLGATGSGLSYTWLRNGAVLGTNSSLVLTNVQAADSGRYDVLVAGTCGNLLSNSATLTVNPATALAPLPNLLKNLGDSVTFSASASGTGPFSYLWRKDGVVIPGATASSLTLTNLSFADNGTYSVEVTGQCSSAMQMASLTINQPPTVRLVSPTNNAVFVVPANFTLLAEARDPDGAVTNVQFFVSATNLLGQTPKQPAFLVRTNVAVGTYTFSARATDNLGASADSAPITVTVIERPPLSLVDSMRLDAATGLFKQTVRVTNPTYSLMNAVRVYISNLLVGQTVYNPSGYSNGVPYVQSAGVIPAGSYVDFVISYYVTNGILPAPVLRAELTAPLTGGLLVSGGAQSPIAYSRLQANKSFMLDFPTETNRLYYVQYSSDLVNWKVSQLPLVGNGASVRWVDDGQPTTESAPNSAARRFYRLIQMP